MTNNRFYSSTALPTTLANAITASSGVSVVINSISGLPSSYPYSLLIDWGTSTQEVVTITGASTGSGPYTFASGNVTRGVDGTTAQTHLAGGSVVHGVSARDFTEPQTHMSASVGVHGLSGAVVGTTDAQTLTNKVLGADPTIGLHLASKQYVDAAVSGTNQTLSSRPNPDFFPVSMTDPRRAADPGTNTTTNGEFAFPNLAKDGNSILMSFKDGYDSATGFTRLYKSTDLGASWSELTIPWPNTGGSADGAGGSISVANNGDWLLASQAYNGSTGTGVWWKKSTDKGTTWGSPSLITNSAFTAGGTFTSSPIVCLANGDWIMSVYGSDTGHTGHISRIYASTDSGSTWALRSTLASVTNIACNETCIQQLSDGSLLALVRCGDYSVRRYTSTDNGVTWSSAVVLSISCDSRPDWGMSPTGRAVLIYRDQATGFARMRYSDTNFATITSTNVLVSAPNKRTSYASLIPVGPRTLLGVMGEIDNTETTGRIYGRYFLDGEGVAPSGQNTYTPAINKAMGQRQILAWDNFNRSDASNGLGVTDSGHQWLPHGGNTNVDWKIVGGIAKNVVTSGGNYVTVDTGVSDGWVEADLYYGVSPSSPLGLVARRSVGNGHALYCSLENGAGTNLNFYYYDGSTQTNILNVTGLDYIAGVYYTMRLVVKGHTMKCLIDGALIGSINMSSTNYTNTNGGTHWGFYGGGSGGDFRCRRFVASA